MKKFMQAAAFAMATLIAMTGCGSSDTDSGEQSVTVWMYQAINDEAKHKELWENLTTKFSQANPGVKVDVKFFPWPKRDESIQTAIASHSGPDLVYLVPDQLSTYADAIEPVDTQLSETRKNDLLPNVRQAVTVEGRMLGAPLLTSSNPLVCNAEAFKTAGVTTYPSTWDDVTQMAPEFTAKDMYAITYSADPSQTLNMSFYPLLWQAGGSVFDANGQPAFNSPQGVRALEFLTGLAEANALEADSLTTAVNTEQTAFVAGRTGCTWSIPASDLAKYVPPEDLIVLPPLKGEQSVAYGTVGSLAVLKDAKHKDAAGRFAAFVTDPRELRRLSQGRWLLLPGEELAPAVCGRPGPGEGQQTLPNVKFGEPHRAARQVMGVLSPEIQAALMGQKTPQQALDAAAEAAKPLIR